MKHGRAVLFYSIIAIFVATAVVTLLGVTGGLAMKDRYLNVLFGALIVELVASVVGLFRATDWFGPGERMLADDVSGDWWQVLKRVDEREEKDKYVTSQNAVSRLTIFYAEAEQQVKLEGESFTAEGVPWAKFWSVAAALNAAKEHMYYFWKGDHSGSDEDFSGVGYIRFTRSSKELEKPDRGTGWFTRGDIDRGRVTERKKVEYRRATPIESEVMEKGEDASLRERLVTFVVSQWPRRCRTSTMEEWREHPSKTEPGREQA